MRIISHLHPPGLVHAPCTLLSSWAHIYAPPHPSMCCPIFSYVSFCPLYVPSFCCTCLFFAMCASRLPCITPVLVMHVASIVQATLCLRQLCKTHMYPPSPQQFCKTCTRLPHLYGSYHPQLPFLPIYTPLTRIYISSLYTTKLFIISPFVHLGLQLFRVG